MKWRLLFAIIVLSIAGYFAYNKYAPVKPFLSTEQLAEELKTEPDNIKEVYELAENYRYVAYSIEDSPNMSLWKFKNRKWHLINDMIWKEIIVFEIKNGDTYYLWHFKGNAMDQLNLYAIYNREFEESYNDKDVEISKYYPQVVLKHSQQIDGTSTHGIFKIPKEWRHAMQRHPQQQDFSFLSHQMLPQYEWDVLNAAGETVDTIRPSSISWHGSEDSNSEIYHVSRFQIWDEDSMELENEIEPSNE